MSELEFLHLIQNIHTSFLDGFMVLITTLGNGGMVWTATAAALLFAKKTRRCSARACRIDCLFQTVSVCPLSDRGAGGVLYRNGGGNDGV